MEGVIGLVLIVLGAVLIFDVLAGRSEELIALITGIAPGSSTGKQGSESVQFNTSVNTPSNGSNGSSGLQLGSKGVKVGQI